MTHIFYQSIVKEAEIILTIPQQYWQEYKNDGENIIITLREAENVQ